MLRAMLCKDVAAHFNVDRKTIERLRIKYNRTGDVADLVHLEKQTQQRTGLL